MHDRPRSLTLASAVRGPAKQDEFYTQLSDIERGAQELPEALQRTRSSTATATTRVSNFFHYFSYNFQQLGLKKLITTSYPEQGAGPLQPERLR